MGFLIEYVSSHFPIVMLLILIFFGVFYLAWTIRGFMNHLENTASKVDEHKTNLVNFEQTNEKQHKQLATDQHDYEKTTADVHKKLFNKMGDNSEALARIEGFINGRTSGKEA